MCGGLFVVALESSLAFSLELAQRGYTLAMESYEELIRRADSVGIRLERVGGLPIWEAQPVFRHQGAIDRIRSSIRASNENLDRITPCGCIHIADVLFLFPDGSFKRPDIAVLCQNPLESEMDAALETIPEAVIEVISAGYEAKDLEISPQFFLAQGVKDVVVFDPRSLLVWHFRKDGTWRLNSPVQISLECGCVCEI
jgi:hypothetical protein